MESRVANDVIDDLAARLVREEDGERSGRASTGVGWQQTCRRDERTALLLALLSSLAFA